MVQPIVETVVEPIIETTVIEGLDLDTEIVTDVIIDTPVQPEVPVNNLPKLPPEQRKENLANALN